VGPFIPQSDIVFMPDADPVHAKIDSKTLGFINADGSNRQEYTFTTVGGALSNFGYQIPGTYASHPRWSMAGDEIVFYLRDLPPLMRLIDKDGRMYGKKCVDIGSSDLALDLDGFAFVVILERDQGYEDYKEISDTALIARYDIKSCKVVSVFSVPVLFGYLRGPIQEAENGLLTAEFWDTDEQMDKILLYNPTTGDSQTFPGYHPSLTKDGSMLAYYAIDGNLVVRDIETGEERYLPLRIKSPVASYENLVSVPGWSPDNQWLVYNTADGDIFKINLETEEKIYLTYGWAPDW